MSDFFVYFQIGLYHVLDWNGYDHVLFLIVLSGKSTFKDWKRVLILTTFFTVGHTLSLLLSVFGIVAVKTYFVELLIPITILITAGHNIFIQKKSNKNGVFQFSIVIALLFGIIHGFGFSNYFKNLLSGIFSDKIFPTLSFSVGIEAAQVAIVVAVLFVAVVCQTVFRVSKRDFVLVLSSIVIGVVLPIILERV